jgi:benzil reductase ((S)-benzoin forming)
MAYILITGTSSGIGAALAERFLQPGNKLFCISRKINFELKKKSKSAGVKLDYTIGNLNVQNVPGNFIRESFKDIASSNEPIVLINNAGVLAPIKSVIALDEESMKEHFNINFFAAAVIISEFMQHMSRLKNPAIVLNISSGAATIPYEGWSMYGSSKAALNMFTKIAGLEWKRPDSKIFALAPGIIESKLQEEIRNTDIEDFPEKETFVKLHNENKLLSAEYVAGIIAKTIFDSRIETGSFISLDDLKKLI